MHVPIFTFLCATNGSNLRNEHKFRKYLSDLLQVAVGK